MPAALVLLVLASLTAACGNEKEEPGQAKRGQGQTKASPAEQAGIDFVVESARGDLAAIKEEVGSRKPADAKYKCAAAMANIEELKKGDKALGDEITKLCAHDIWAAQIKVSVEATETERAAKPGEKLLTGCYDAYIALANDELVKAQGVDDATRALIDRYKALCPDAFAK